MASALRCVDAMNVRASARKYERTNVRKKVRKYARVSTETRVSPALERFGSSANRARLGRYDEDEDDEDEGRKEIVHIYYKY